MEVSIKHVVETAHPGAQWTGRIERAERLSRAFPGTFIARYTHPNGPGGGYGRVLVYPVIQDPDADQAVMDWLMDGTGSFDQVSSLVQEHLMEPRQLG